MSISERASSVLGDSLLFKAFLKCKESPYDAKSNPDGYINAGTAENEIIHDLIGPKLQEGAAKEILPDHLKYVPAHGTNQFRQALLDLYTRNLEHADKIGLTIDHVAAATGCGAVVNLMTFALCERGDDVLIPAPFYGGFDMDVGYQGVGFQNVFAGSDKGFVATADDLKAHWESMSDEERARTKMLLITQPNNPLGYTYSFDEMQAFLKFGIEAGLHVVSDEIYANSVWDNDTTFVSMLDVAAQTYDSTDTWTPHVHIATGLAKDFAVNGLKVGYGVSQNASLMRVLSSFTLFTSVSSHTQEVLVHALGDHEWRDSLIAENNRRLAAAWSTITTQLDTLNIPFLPATAGFFVWIDLRAWMDGDDVDAEMALFERILDSAHLYINPGSSFYSHDEPGWFRLLYAKSEDDLLTIGARLASVLNGDGTSSSK